MRAELLVAAILTGLASAHPKSQKSQSCQATGAASTVTVTVTAPASASPTSTSSTGRVKFGGVNIAGFDFGCDTNGTCNLNNTGTFLATTGYVMHPSSRRADSVHELWPHVFA